MTTSSSRGRSVGRTIGVVAGGAALVVVVACDNGTAPGSSSLPVRVAVTSSTTQSVVGELRFYSARGLNMFGRNVGGTPHWESSDSSVAIVDENGLVTAVAPGQARIIAHVGAATGYSTIAVAPWVLPAPSQDSVASVTIVPQSGVVGLLGSTQFTAVLRDAHEQLVDRTVAWSMDDGLIAAVNSVGLVTGLLAGDATLRAVSGSVTGSVPLHVSLASLLAPTQLAWPNLPAGFTPLADEPMNDVQSFWSVQWNDQSNGAFVSDSTSPASAGSVWQVRYPAGFGAGSAPATLTYSLGGATKVFVGTWWKANANWQGHPSNVNKIQFLFPSSGYGDMYLAAYGPPGGPYELRSVVQFPSFERKDALRPNRDPGLITMGDWHRIEWLVQYSSPNAADGIVRWWLDGVLVGDYDNIRFPPARLDNFKLSPTWGGVGGAKTQTDYYWYDHVFIARAP